MYISRSLQALVPHGVEFWPFPFGAGAGVGAAAAAAAHGMTWSGVLERGEGELGPSLGHGPCPGAFTRMVPVVCEGACRLEVSVPSDGMPRETTDCVLSIVASVSVGEDRKGKAWPLQSTMVAGSRAVSLSRGSGSSPGSGSARDTDDTRLQSIRGDTNQVRGRTKRMSL